jgi:hypothetical protein
MDAARMPVAPPEFFRVAGGAPIGAVKSLPSFAEVTDPLALKVSFCTGVRLGTSSFNSYCCDAASQERHCSTPEGASYSRPDADPGLKIDHNPLCGRLISRIGRPWGRS